MTSLDDTRYCPQCAAWANSVLDRDIKIARLQKRIEKLEGALFNEIEDSFDHEWPPYWVRLIGGKRRLAQLAKDGKI